MSETLDEALWGPEPSGEEVVAAEHDAVKRAEEWKVNPPEKPANYQPHPDGPNFQYPTE